MKNWMKNFQPVNILNKVMIIPDWDKNRYDVENVIKLIYNTLKHGNLLQEIELE